MKDILTKRNVKRLLVLLALVAIAVTVSGCAPTNGQAQAPISHTSGNWWDRWIVYYVSAFLLWLAKLLGNNYGWTIIVFTILIRIILLPLNALSIKSTTKMQRNSTAS